MRIVVILLKSTLSIILFAENAFANVPDCYRALICLKNSNQRIDETSNLQFWPESSSELSEKIEPEKTLGNSQAQLKTASPPSEETAEEYSLTYTDLSSGNLNLKAPQEHNLDLEIQGSDTIFGTAGTLPEMTSLSEISSAKIVPSKINPETSSVNVNSSVPRAGTEIDSVISSDLPLDKPLSSPSRRLSESFQPVQGVQNPSSEFAQIPPELGLQEPDTPLRHNQSQRPTAIPLQRGEVIYYVFTRNFFPPGSVEDTGNTIYANTGVRWGITDNFELTFDAAVVDGAAPGEQGDFRVNRNPSDANLAEILLEAKYKVWENASQTQTLSTIGMVSVGDRGFEFTGRDGTFFDQAGEVEAVPAFQLPFTLSPNRQWSFTVAPTIAFFQDDQALFLKRLPTDNSDTFGTTFGLTGAISYSPVSRVTLWGDAFFPFTGNNSISRESGELKKTVAFNTGVRYLVNPRLAIDVFATNTLGHRGPLSLTADREFVALGVGTSLMPDFIPSNRNYADSFNTAFQGRDASFTIDGLGFIDGGTVPSRKFAVDIQGGSQGLLTSLRYGPVKDFEAGIYLDYIFGDVDESEQGFSAKVRFLNQAENQPFTLSAAATVGLTSEAFLNFINGNRDELANSGLENNVPFFIQDDSGETGELFIATFSVPVHYAVSENIAVWLTPTVGFVQRSGFDIAGFNVGGSVPIIEDLSFVAEIGANLIGDGNAFIGGDLDNAIPWNAGIRWNPSKLLGIASESNPRPLTLDIYATNRVGASPWHQLRVRDQNEVAIGAGLSFRF